MKGALIAISKKASDSNSIIFHTDAKKTIASLYGQLKQIYELTPQLSSFVEASTVPQTIKTELLSLVQTLQ